MAECAALSEEPCEVILSFMFKPKVVAFWFFVVLIGVFPFYYKQVVLEESEKASLKSDIENFKFDIEKASLKSDTESLNLQFNNETGLCSNGLALILQL